MVTRFDSKQTLFVAIRRRPEGRWRPFVGHASNQQFVLKENYFHRHKYCPLFPRLFRDALHPASGIRARPLWRNIITVPLEELP
jgi:hypothetical protein